MECGRYVTGPHGVLVARVINRSRKGREIVGLDASMSALMRPALYGAYHHISLPFASGRDEGRFDVVGALCESMDRFAVDRVLPGPRVGDIAVIIEPTQPSRVAPLLLGARGLTPRERDVALLVLRGTSTQAISTQLHLSPYTVKDHLKSIFDTMGVRSRRDLVATVLTGE